MLREGAHVKCETNNKLLGGPRQTRKIQYGREVTRGSVYPKDEAEMDIFARCLKK